MLGPDVDGAAVWRLQEVADAARELPYENQSDRLRQALSRLVSQPATSPERPPARS